MGERTGAATQGGGCPRMREAVAGPLWLARLPWRVLGSGGGLLLANRQVERSRTAHAPRAGRSMLGAEATRRPDRALSPNGTPGSARAAGHGHESTPANRSRRHPLRSRRRHLGRRERRSRSARISGTLRPRCRACSRRSAAAPRNPRQAGRVTSRVGGPSRPGTRSGRAGDRICERSCDIGRLNREGDRLGGRAPMAASGEYQLPGSRPSDGRTGGVQAVLTAVGAETGGLPRGAPVCCFALTDARGPFEMVASLGGCC